MLETMDKLRFDCYRVGLAKENMEEMEPVIRNTNLLSFDINAINTAMRPPMSAALMDLVEKKPVCLPAMPA